MSNITILYYTCNLISEHFALAVRNNISECANGNPIISISQKPVPFGDANICTVGLTPSIHSLYLQILLGARQAETKYVACCEDDTLYTPEHFQFEPTENAFYYNENHWHLCTSIFFYKGHRVMSQCIAPRELMIETIEKRFEKFPPGSIAPRGFGEPGKWERNLGLPEVGTRMFRTEVPSVTFRHAHSLSGRRVIPDRYPIKDEIPYWGKAIELWNRVYGGNN